MAQTKKISLARWYGRLINTALLITYRHPELNSSVNRTTIAEILSAAFSVATDLERDVLTFLTRKLEGKDQMLRWLTTNDTEVRRGMAESNHLFNNGEILRLKEDYDFYYDLNKAEMEVKRKARRRRSLIYAAIAVIIAALVVYNLPYFKELRLWNKINETRNLELVQEYYSEFPDGDHYEEVLYIDICDNSNPRYAIEEYHWKYIDGKYYEEVLYLYAKATSAPGDAINEYIQKYPDGQYIAEIRDLQDDYLYECVVNNGNNLRDINNYFNTFPEGKHIAEVEAAYNSRWDNIDTQYNAVAKTNANSNDVKFIRDMLRYMRENRVHEIAINVDVNINVKDYSSYPKKVKDFVDHPFFGYRYNGHSIESNIASVTSAFSPLYAQQIKSKIIDGVESKLSTIVFDEFIKVRTVDSSSAPSNAPVLNVTCKIVNQQEYESLLEAYIPKIWTHVRKSNFYIHPTNLNTFLGYLLGIAVDFEAKFSIPEQNKSRTYKFSGSPGSADISNVNSSQDAYKVMASRCVNDFAEKYSRRIGMSQ